ncbi:MAG: hypothetical protein V4642_05885 [Bacteroidota bacterium]
MLSAFSFKNILTTALCCTFFATLLGSCNDVPSDVGADFVKDTSIITKVASSTVLPLIEKTSVERIGQIRVNDLVKNIGFNNPTIMAGATPIGQKAYAFLNPGKLADSLKTITEANIISADLVLQPTRYALGDTANQLSLSVFALKEFWKYNDTLENIFPPLLAGKSTHFDENTPVGSFKSDIDRKNDSTPITITISKTLIAGWFVTSDTTTGLALAPNADSKFIQQFRSLTSNFSPAINLRVIYTAPTTQDTVTLLIPMSIHGTFVNAPGAESESDILIQSGTAYRTAIDFDLTSIEPFSSIHSAKFIINLKSSLLSSYPQRVLLVERIANPAGNFNDILASYGVKNDAGQYEFTGLGSRVEKWLRGTSKGRLYIRTESEGENADRLIFHGLNATDSTLRPRIEILYSTRPK